MWANEMILVFVSIFLSTWGAIYSRKNGRKDFALGFAFLITSLILLFWGINKIVNEVPPDHGQYLNAFIYLGIFILWIIAFLVGRTHWSRRLTQGPIQIAVIMPLVFWLIVRDEIYSWQDTFLYLSLTFLISVMTFKRNNSMFT